LERERERVSVATVSQTLGMLCSVEGIVVS